LRSSFADDIELALNKKSITIQSGKASKLILIFDNGKETSITHYFNYYNDFVINFEDLSLVYTNRKLFKDGKLINNVDSFIEAFNGKTELNTVTSEKGNFTNASAAFLVGKPSLDVSLPERKRQRACHVLLRFLA
jgi:hypothetical protein